MKSESLKPEVRKRVSRAGGKARAAKLSQKERSEIARRAAAARWKPYPGATEGMLAVSESQVNSADDLSKH